MLNLTLAMARKDLSVTLTRSAGLVQALLLGLLLIFMFSLSRKAGDTVSPQTAAAIFWLASPSCSCRPPSRECGSEKGSRGSS